ncbi:molybdopterin-synthase adenylyltransferase MoeB [Flavobacterium nackdongense]|uniref:Molybdopterin-synthase adenylyltransferase n=1 Tax=Flavobacterium nackdongense TaxID=2547394 RepID=A0A4P6YCH7_9FLAO|nr:molybdopterin-synthase adenylyltransferase MoeB [Flavobacterium nackdongense]QBN18013.1 molybdopterin-synthase adenylyltransferase MoeB [Flavobacterium nackdongense]
MNKASSHNRYQRQIQLKEIGQAGQDKITKAKVLVIGAGGLGCPALQYLAAAGVGTIGIVDFDVVEMSNLQRQILYTVVDIGQSKASTAAKKIEALNPQIKIETYTVQITNKNALEILQNYDIIIDGSDNFATRYLVNDACILLEKPLVYGAVLRFEGQIGVFNFLDNEGNCKTNYRDLFPKPPDSATAISCNEVGVLGVIPGIIGTMQAAEALKIITGVGKPLTNKIISYNALENSFYDFEIAANSNPSIDFPKSKDHFLAFNYEWFCNSNSDVESLSVEEFDILRKNERITIIDVREKGELPEVDEFPFTLIPLSAFENLIATIPIENKIVVFCKSGQRSAKAIKIMKEKYPNCQAFNLKGGIDEWKIKN